MTAAIPPDLPTGGGLFDLLSNPAIGTPAGFALATMLYLGKLWLDSRKEKRADRGDRRSDESHIVEETKDILLTRKEEAADLRRQAQRDRRYIERLEEENREFRVENAELKAILADRIGYTFVKPTNPSGRVPGGTDATRGHGEAAAVLPAAVRHQSRAIGRRHHGLGSETGQGSGESGSDSYRTDPRGLGGREAPA